MNETRTISRAEFGCLSAAMTTTFMVSFAIALACARDALGWQFDPLIWVSFFSLACLIVSSLLLDGILKRLGLSRSGKAVEACTRSVAHPDGNVAPGEVVEVNVAKKVKILVLLAVPLLIALCGGFALFYAEFGVFMRWLSGGFAVFLGRTDNHLAPTGQAV